MCRFENCLVRPFCVLKSTLSMADDCRCFIEKEPERPEEESKMSEDFCQPCIHHDVCSLKGQLASCVAAVEKCSIKTPNGETAYLKDIDFINIDICCKHYHYKEVMR